MKAITSYYKETRIAYLKSVMWIGLCALLLFPGGRRIVSGGDNIFVIRLDGEEVGTVASPEEAKDDLQQARLNLSTEAGTLVFSPGTMEFESDELMIGQVDAKETVIANMEAVLSRDKITDHRLAYMIKINEFTIYLENADDVIRVLQAALDKYDGAGEFLVDLTQDPGREINVLTTKITNSSQRRREAMAVPCAGVAKDMLKIDQNLEYQLRESFDDFDYGMVDLYYDDEIEVLQTYIRPEKLSDPQEAIDILTQDQPKNAVYEVAEGDTLSEIALKVDIPLDQIIAMNENLEDENSTIRVGDELVITVPEPVLSVGRQEEIYYEEVYDEEPTYIDNDEWYITEKVVRQQPSSGYRNVAALVTYHNDKTVATDILKDKIVVKAVPKIVERGTKIPPSYIKPISGGRLSSGFGRRSAPTRGASTYHKGVDWATPIGTAVMASSSGTVARAGWGSGYGYVIYINHPDGRQTRYGHLSKILVKVGQSVSQGQKIALSGNTGRSTGPHVHFEILIGGSQVNPLNYLN